MKTIVLFINFPQNFDEWIFAQYFVRFPPVLLFVNQNGSSEGLTLLCAMIVTVADCSVLVVFTWWQLGRSRSAKPKKKKEKKGIYTVQHVLFCHHNQTCQYSHILVGSTSSSSQALQFSLSGAEQHCMKITARETDTAGQVFLFSCHFGQYSWTFFLLVKQRNCRPRRPQKKTDRYRLGHVSVFNRIMAVWFDVLLSNTKKKYGLCFLGFPLFQKLY